MKLSVAAYRASASNVNRRLSNNARQLSAAAGVAMSRSVSWGSNQNDNSDGGGSCKSSPSQPVPPNPFGLSPERKMEPSSPAKEEPLECGAEKPEGDSKDDEEEEKKALLHDDKKVSPVQRPPRSRGTQRWMKLRTTVQISGAVASAVKEKKPPLKREDSFLKRFSTRQIAESDTVDNDGEEAGGGSEASAARRRRRRRREEHITVVNPDENFYFAWLSLLTLCVLYNCWTLIVRQAFPELQKTVQPLWIALDGFSDVVFLCDILVQIRTGYLEQGLMVYDSRKLAMHYVRSRAFLLDLASLLPLDIVQVPVNMAIPIVRFPRFLKLYRSYNYYYMVESRTLYPNLWRVVNLIHILLLLAHWFGCFYFLLSEAEGFHGEWTYPNYRQPEREAFATLTRKYLGSLYWSTLTLTTIGDLPTPESDWEYLFTIVSYLIGVFIFATIVGQVGNVITNRNASRLEFERLLDGAKLYMRQHKVPRDMQRRVQRWYDYSWSRGRVQGGGDINSALGILPDKLKTELALHVNLYTLKKVSIFQECQPEFLHDLVLKMKAYIFTPGDLICRKGEVAREMFIIADGILEVISEAGKVLTTMRAGDFFGEIGILNLDGLNKRTADVRSVGYAELFSLSREDVLAAMKDYPEAQEILQSLGRKRLMEAKLAAAGVRKESDSDSRKGSSSGGKDSSTGEGDSTKSRAVQMVRRLKRDARGLRNYLRRGGRHEEHSDQRKADSVRIEMEPMSPTGEQPASTDIESSQQGAAGDPHHDGLTFRRFFWGKKEPTMDEGRRESKFGKTFSIRTRGILMRMQRVNSTTEPPISPPTPAKRVTVLEPKADVESSVEPLGAGLPLLQRLLLLKEREERQALEAKTMSSPPVYEEALGAGLPILKRLKLMREKEEKDRKELEEKSAAAAKQGPAQTVDKEPAEKSPVAIASGSGLPATFFPSEPIGAGLPLLQRLKLLREREEQERAEAERREAAAAARSNGAKTSLAKALLLKKLETLKEEDKSQNAESMDRGRSFLEEEPSPAGRGQVHPVSPVHETVPNLLTCDRPSRESKMSVTAQLHTKGPPSPTPSKSPGQTPPAQPSPCRQVPAATIVTKSASEALPTTPKRSGWLALKESVMKTQSVSSKSPLHLTVQREEKTPSAGEKVVKGATKNGTKEANQRKEHEDATDDQKEVEDGGGTESSDAKQSPSLVSATKILADREIEEEAPTSVGDYHSPRTPPPSPVAPSPPTPAQQQLLQQQQLQQQQLQQQQLQQQRPMDFKPEEYLADLLVGVKQVLQSRLEDIQDQFKSRLVSLEEEVRRKDLIIKRLEETLQRCEVRAETGGATSPQVSKSPEDDVGLSEGQDICDKKTSSSTASEESLTGCTSEVDDFFDDDDFEEPSDVTHPGYVSHPRRSWPLLPPWSERHRPGAAQRAWESQAALVIDPEQLWRVEFPGVSGGPLGRHWQGSPVDEDDRTTIADGDSSSGSGSQLDIDEADGAAVEAEAAARHDSSNNWEIKMLAEQLLQREGDKVDESDDSDTSHDAEPLHSPSGGKQGTPSRAKLQRRSSVRDRQTFEEEVSQPPPRARAMSLDVQMGTRFPGGSTPPVIEEPTLEENEDDETIKVVVQEAEVLEARGEESLLGVLQQLSPTERRELERLLEVATRRHLSRQLSLHQTEVGNQDFDTPRRQHSLTEGMATLSPHSPASPVSSGIRRRSANHHSPPPTSAAAPSAYAVPQAAEGQPDSNNSQCFYEDEVGRGTRRPALPPPLTLVSPPAEDDSVSICIPEYEPLLGPK